MRATTLRQAFRLLARTPVFTLTAVLSLAAGIAGTAGIFSLADALLLRPRPGVADPATLVDVGRTVRGQGLDNFGYPLFEAMRDATTTLEGLAAHTWEPRVMSLGDAQASGRIFASLVSWNYFAVAGTRAAAGRFFLPEEDRTPDTHPVVVLSHELWTRRFGEDADVVGRAIRLNNRSYTVVGVAEEGFAGTTFIGTDLWVPMAMDRHVRASTASLLDQAGAVWMRAIGRLKPGITPAQVRDELQAIMLNDLASRGDERAATWGVGVARSGRVPAPLAGPVGGFLALLGALTGLVLLIACANVAGMLLVRGLDRRREFATRLAVGASRRRLIGQLLMEGLALALAAGAFSVPLTYWLVGVLASWQPSLPLPLALDLRVDLRVLGVAFLLAAAAAAAFALLPAIQTTRVDVAPALRGAHASTGRRRVWLRQALVASQVAVSLLLLVVAGLFLRSLQETAHVDVGFNAQDVDILQIDTRIAGYQTTAEGTRAVNALLERFRALPGVTSAGAARMVPLFSGSLGLGGLRAPGYSGAEGDRVDADWNVVTPGFFEAMQTPIVEGRAFGEQDRQGAPFAVIVNETLARRVWPGRSAIGQTLVQEQGDDERPLLVVGVARDGKYRSVAESPQSYIYVPLAQQFMSDVTLFVRRTPGASRANDLRAAVAAFDPMLPVIHTSTLEAQTSLALLPQRLAAWIAAAVGSIGLFLAALGLYGITAFAVSQRRRELAIRLAVGAQPASVVRLVLRGAAVLGFSGAVIGFALATAASALLQTLLVGIGAVDPIAFGAAVVLLGAVMGVATWTPARRAARMDPVEALRAE